MFFTGSDVTGPECRCENSFYITAIVILTVLFMFSLGISVITCIVAALRCRVIGLTQAQPAPANSPSLETSEECKEIERNPAYEPVVQMVQKGIPKKEDHVYACI